MSESQQQNRACGVTAVNSNTRHLKLSDKTDCELQQQQTTLRCNFYWGTLNNACGWEGIDRDD
jgi:hypothetical protein